MKIVLEIPKEFESHFKRDKFHDSMRRINADFKHADLVLSGNYEIELLEMLEEAFKDSWEIRFKYLDDGLDNVLRLEEAYHKITKYD